MCLYTLSRVNAKVRAINWRFILFFLYIQYISLFSFRSDLTAMKRFQLFHACVFILPLHTVKKEHGRLFDMKFQPKYSNERYLSYEEQILLRVWPDGKSRAEPENRDLVIMMAYGKFANVRQKYKLVWFYWCKIWFLSFICIQTSLHNHTLKQIQNKSRWAND